MKMKKTVGITSVVLLVFSLSLYYSLALILFKDLPAQTDINHPHFLFVPLIVITILTSIFYEKIIKYRGIKKIIKGILYLMFIVFIMAGLATHFEQVSRLLLFQTIAIIDLMTIVISGTICVKWIISS